MNVTKIDQINLQARLAQSVERETLNLNVVGSSPTLGVYIFFLPVLHHFLCHYTRILKISFLFILKDNHKIKMISLK